MSRLAFLFPGQGSQYPGMGKDLYDAFPQVRELYERASHILDFDAPGVSFAGPAETLRQTRYTQPCILLHSLAVLSLLEKEKVAAAACAGHSLGEYSALSAAGALDPDTVIRLVGDRARFMQEAGEEQPGTMAAVIGLARQEAERVCREAGSAGVVQPANFNSPEQIAISGSIPAVRLAMELAVQAGARKTVELVVGGAFHSPLMQTAADRLRAALQNVCISPARMPVFANVSAEPLTEPETIRRALGEQIARPVLWEDTMKKMIDYGIDLFLEVGPGTVLRGLMRRIDREAEVISLGDISTLEEFFSKRESWGA